MFFNYPLHYKGNKGKLDQQVLGLVGTWLDRYGELEDIVPKLQETAKEKGVILNPDRLGELESSIELLINEEEVREGAYKYSYKDEDEDGVEQVYEGTNYTREYYPYASKLMGEDISGNDWGNKEDQIKYKLLLQFIDIIHSLYSKNDINDISTEISQVIASVLNKNERDTYHFVSDNSVFKLFQTMHGDVNISRNNIISNGSSFFGETDVVEVSEEPKEGISLYQRVSELYANLLLFCFQAHIYPNEIIQLKSIKGHIPNASDALDSSSYMTYSFTKAIEDDNYRGMSFSGIPGPHVGFTYKTDLGESNDTLNVYRVYEEKGKGDELALKINVDEIGPLILALHHLPGRSAAQIDKLLEVFQEKYIEKYGNPNK